MTCSGTHSWELAEVGFEPSISGLSSWVLGVEVSLPYQTWVSGQLGWADSGVEQGWRPNV